MFCVGSVAVDALPIVLGHLGSFRSLKIRTPGGPQLRGCDLLCVYGFGSDRCGFYSSSGRNCGTRHRRSLDSALQERGPLESLGNELEREDGFANAEVLDALAGGSAWFSGSLPT